MNNYKSTLNLPKTKFPMQGNLVKKEPEILERWISDNIYNIIRVTKKGKKIFVLHDGPPYANGKIHIGHSVNKILKDIIIKSKGLSGFDSPYIPGWDCHGLPIELNVERKYSKPGKEFTASAFRAKCREYAIEQVNNQREDFIRLGVFGDWSHPYLTMDFKTEANTIRVLSKIIRNGYLYKEIKPIYWCTDCHSVLAEAEIEYYDKISLCIDVMFEAINQDIIKNKFNFPNVNGPISLVIWTTTPWTLPANRAISISSEFRYALVQIEDRALILAENLVESTMKRANIDKYVVLSSINGVELEWMYFKHPFLNFNVPVVLDKNVTKIGTGAIHVAGGHGSEDYNISKKYNLEIVNLIGADGIYLPNIYPILDGTDISKASDIIINILRKRKSLISTEKLQHAYPHCWRHKTPIVFRATPQWFISMDRQKVREKLLKEIRNVRWIPSWSQAHIESMVMNRPDWCISRQREWGVPMSLFIHKKTKELHPCTLELMEEIAKRVEIGGAQMWWDLDLQDISANTDHNLYEKVLDTLDVWFDSGSTHTSIIDMRSEFAGHTADMYLEGIDQHRGWFISSLMISTAIKGKAPYRQVLTHGFIVDENGRKMSKSAGNIISPKDIINEFGADILRLWVASTDYTGEMAISNKILGYIVDSYRRIRNTVRFMLASINDFNPKKDIIKMEEMVVIDRWAVNYTKITQKNIINSYESYNFHAVVQYLMHFCSIEMGSFYLSIIKDRQYTAKANSLARRSCQTALYHIIEALVRWIAPIISFTADEIWDYLPGEREKYVFISEWYEELFYFDKNETMNDIFWSKMLQVRSEVNKCIERARSEKKIGNSLEAEVMLYAEPELAIQLASLGNELRFLLLTSNAEVSEYINADKIAQQSECIKGLKIVLKKANGKKCSRCWHYTTDINQIEKYADICERCVNNIIGNGEIRRFI